MKQAKLIFATTSLAVCLVTTSSFSQTGMPLHATVAGVFEASTPCDDISKAIFEIPPGTKCEWMKWNLTLYQDAKNSAPSTYKLVCRYGLPKQGTRDFMAGAETMELKGKWAIGKGTIENPGAVIYTLSVDNAAISLSFLKPDQNLLHLLDKDHRLMKGNGAWSYTLNRIDPIPANSTGYTPQIIPQPVMAADSLIVGVFEGRTPCDNVLRELNSITATGCQIIKCHFILYQDAKTHMPSTFLLQTIYVGKGNTTYSNTGKWMLTQGTKNDPGALVYQLDFDKPQVSLALLKGDDNILFFLDKKRDFMVGNNYVSYTMNRVKK
ncbi:MAG: hypothetical protein ABI707_10900 [Ferruginibacter sp.]